ncbi:MAG: lactate utilization protein [Acidobacteria bacterium]|nr:lactate utilization protein [Acidobacteriota bacterium]
MTTKEDIRTVVKALKANNFNVQYLDKAKDAVPLILDLIPRDATLEMAGSMSVVQLGLQEKLKERGNTGLEFPRPGEVPSRKDVLLVSTNAVTLDGKLVNLDGMGNRVAGMIYGVKKVILLVGQNKIVRDLDEALERVKMVIAPYHAKYLGLKTPCAYTGECNDCDSPMRICNITTILWKKPPMMDFTIILVGEDLGLGWDPAWPQERIEKIQSTYRKEIQEFMAKLPPPPYRSK